MILVGGKFFGPIIFTWIPGCSAFDSVGIYVKETAFVFDLMMFFSLSYNFELRIKTWGHTLSSLLQYFSSDTVELIRITPGLVFPDKFDLHQLHFRVTTQNIIGTEE